MKILLQDSDKNLTLPGFERQTKRNLNNIERCLHNGLLRKDPFLSYEPLFVLGCSTYSPFSNWVFFRVTCDGILATDLKKKKMSMLTSF